MARPHVPRNPDTFMARSGAMALALENAQGGAEVLPLLREWLRKNSSKVMTLFRKWDTDENGEVSVLEFKQAMRLLGLKAADTDIARLFASFDPDGSGAIDFRELNKALRVYAAWP